MPVCVIFQTMLLIIAGDIPEPIIDPVESATLPAHVPVTLVVDDEPEPPVGALGLVGDGELLPHAAAKRLPTSAAAERMRIVPPVPRMQA